MAIATQTLTATGNTAPVQLNIDTPIEVTMGLTGTFGSGTATLQASSDGINFSAVNSPAGTVVALTAAGHVTARIVARAVRIALTGATSPSLIASVGVASLNNRTASSATNAVRADN